jgi:transcriptional regulator with AAA-type ATPase domain
MIAFSGSSMDPSRDSASSDSESARKGERSRLRLRGQVGGEEATFLLSPGDNPVGSSGANAVVLPVRGVSRRHACLRADRDGLVVEDLDSKNGTFVNGRPVRCSPVCPGDEVGFGPARLRVEPLAAGDVELAIDLGEGGSRASAAVSRATTRLSGGEEGGARAWVALLAEVVDHLAAAPEDPRGALDLVARWLELGGAALVEWRPREEPVLLAATGTVGELAAAAAGSARRPFATTEVPPRSAFTLHAGGTAFGLVLWGEFPDRRSSWPLLAALTRLFHRFRAEPLADPAPPGRPATELVFPEGYVPGESPAMRSLYRQLEQLAAGDLPVLVVGETGVGKEPVVRTLHAASPRRDGPLVAVNCAAIPADLLEAEMFGIGKGAATGVAARRGKFVEAAGGTLLLDEIGDMPLALQAKLLRALQEKEVQPVGRSPVAVDVRVVAATNQDLRSRIAAGRFRRDLYYRIAGYVLHVPPLRQRTGDLPRLVGHFLAVAGTELGKSVRGLTVKALRHLTGYSWPGNVRELENEVRRLVYLCPQGGVVDSTMLPDHVLAPLPEEGDAESGDLATSLDLADHTAHLERRLIRVALARTRGNQTQAARLLGISRNGLANRVKRLGIDPDPG